MYTQQPKTLAPGEEIAVIGSKGFTMVRASGVGIEVGQRGSLENLRAGVPTIRVVHTAIEIVHRDSGRIVRFEHNAEGNASVIMVTRMGP